MAAFFGCVSEARVQLCLECGAGLAKLYERRELVGIPEAESRVAVGKPDDERGVGRCIVALEDLRLTAFYKEFTSVGLNECWDFRKILLHPVPTLNVHAANNECGHFDLLKVVTET